MEKNKRVRSIFLPVGIAFALLAVAFTFEAGEVQWMWQSQPLLGLLFVLFGLSFVAVHLVRQFLASRQR